MNTQLEKRQIKPPMELPLGLIKVALIAGFIVVVVLVYITFFYHASSSQSQTYGASGFSGIKVMAPIANTSTLFFTVTNPNNYSVFINHALLSIGNKNYTNIFCNSFALNFNQSTHCFITVNLSGYSHIFAPLSLNYTANSSTHISSGNISVQIGLGNTSRNSSSSNKTVVNTIFIESGLPSGTTWYVSYAGQNLASATQVINLSSSTGSYAFSISAVSVPSANCSTTYTASPSSGMAIAGSTQYIIFSGSTRCSSLTTIFTENGLQVGTPWSVTYDGITNTSSTISIYFITKAGNYAFSIQSLSSNKCKYSPLPASGTATAGSTISISYGSICNTTFSETGLPTGYNWSVTYNSITKAADSPNTITFSSSSGNFSFFVSALTQSTANGTLTYTPKPSSGYLATGSTEPIVFSNSTAISSYTTSFTESNLPSGYTWSVIYDGIQKSAPTGSVINFSTAGGSFTASVSIPGLQCISNPIKINAGSSYDFNNWNCAMFVYTTNIRALWTVINSTTNGNSIVKTSLFPYVGGLSTAVGLAVDPFNKLLYVANSVQNLISVINVSSNTVMRNITIPSYPGPQSIAIAPNGKILYIATSDYDANSVMVINASSGKSIASKNISDISVPTTTAEQVISVSPDGKFVYVLNGSHAVTIISTISDSVVSNINLNASSNLNAIAVSKDGRFVYVVSEYLNSTFIINASSHELIATIPTGYGPSGIAISPDGKLIYVTNRRADTIYVFNSSSYRLVANITNQTMFDPRGIVISPNGKYAYVTNDQANLYVINTSSYKLVNQFYLGNSYTSGPIAVAILSKPLSTTNFTESGLPTGYTWSVTYDGIQQSASTGSPLIFTSIAGTFTATVTVSGLNCTIPSASITAGSSHLFSGWTCYTRISESGLPTGYTWSAQSGKTRNSTATGTSMQFSTGSGTFPKINASTSAGLSCTAIPKLNVVAGTSAVFSSWYCITTLSEQNLPLFYGWAVTYNKLTKSAQTGSSITFNTSSGASIANVSVSGGLSCAINSNPTINAGTNYVFSIWSCTTRFNEANLPSGYYWYVTYNGNPNSSKGSSILFSTASSSSSYSFSVSTSSNSSGLCTTTYTPHPSSGNAYAGSIQNISFTAGTSCTTPTYFNESGLLASQIWYVTYDGVQNSSSTSIISFKKPPGSYSFSIPTACHVIISGGKIIGYDLYTATPASGSLQAGSTESVSFSGQSVSSC